MKGKCFYGPTLNWTATVQCLSVLAKEAEGSFNFCVFFVLVQNQQVTFPGYAQPLIK